jgi:outer membrane lipoprotein carrier protein
LTHFQVRGPAAIPVHRPVQRPQQRWSRGALRGVGLGLALFCLAQSAAADGVSLVKDYLRGLNSLQADFRQITLTADGGQMLESRGTFYLLRPNRFRWDYVSPSEQQIVADGKRIYVYDKELAQVSHRSQKQILDGTPAQLLASDQPPENYFTIRNIDRGDNRVWAELVPKTSDTDVEKLQIGFVKGELDTLVMEDRFGQLTRFVFTDIDRNPRLQYSFFRFQRPAGADFLKID